MYACVYLVYVRHVRVYLELVDCSVGGTGVEMQVIRQPVYAFYLTTVSFVLTITLSL